MWIIILGILALASSESYSRQLVFIGEEVELKVADTMCTVHGLYWFRNTSASSEQTLFYPIVIYEQLETARWNAASSPSGISSIRLRISRSILSIRCLLVK